MVTQLFKSNVNGKSHTRHTAEARAAARNADANQCFQRLLSDREGMINVESGLFAVENVLWKESKVNDAPLRASHADTYVSVQVATVEELASMIEAEEFSTKMMLDYIIGNHFNSSESKWACNEDEVLPLPKNWNFNKTNLCYVSNEGITISFKFAARAADMFDNDLEKEFNQLLDELGEFLNSK
tara:strand:+ start:3641 stop:4195 length:555 start_codon:yes stop_codon:yes gene_type:complete